MKIKSKDYNNVLDYFYTHDNNITSAMADKFNLSISYTSYIIDYHLSLKRNYMGDPIYLKHEKYKNQHPGSIKVKVTDGFGDFIGIYKSYKECADALGVHKEDISRKLIGNKMCRIAHRKQGTYNYEKI